MPKNILILGAGFGGLRCALDLARKVSSEWKVVLVDRDNYQIYYPQLYELVLPEDGQDCVVPIAKIIRGTGIEFVQSEVQGIDCKNKTVTLAKGSALAFEYLVLALGAGTDYFGVEGLEAGACTLKSLTDAQCIREKIEKFLKGAVQGQSNEFEVVIGGAGATGVEVAAELAYLFRKIPKGLWSIHLVEALSSVLWMFPPEVGKYAHKRLTNLGVHVMLDTCIKKVVGDSHQQVTQVEVILAPRPLKPGETESALACDFLPEHEKRISADLLLWAGGVRATPLLTKCAMPVDKKGRMEVDEYLRTKAFENVFAIGDNATLIDPKTQKPVPATAQAAVEHGRLAAQNIALAINGKAPQPYRFHDFSAVIPLGHKDAVAVFGGKIWCGRLAWILRKAADCRYFVGILGWWSALKRCIMA